MNAAEWDRPTARRVAASSCFSVPDAQAKLIKEMAHRIEQLQDHIAALELDGEALSHSPEYWADGAGRDAGERS